MPESYGRFAASVGSGEAFLRCLCPGAITVLSGMATSEIGVLSDLLRLAFLPPGCQVCRKPAQFPYADGRPRLLLLAPETDDDEISRYALRQFHERIAAAPGVAAPVLILLPDEAVPAKELARYLPPPIQLAPVGRDIMLRHLQVSYDDFDEAVVFDAMPTDQTLAGLTTIALNVALRAPDAVDAARRLRPRIFVAGSALARLRPEWIKSKIKLAGESSTLSARVIRPRETILPLPR